MAFIDGDFELTGYEEHLRDEATHADYMREAYGDACPGCGTLRYGGDCGKCYDFEAEARDEEARMAEFEPTQPTTEEGEDYPGQRISGLEDAPVDPDDILF